MHLLAILPPVHLFTLVGTDPDSLQLTLLRTVSPAELLPLFVIAQGAPMGAADSSMLLIEWGRIAALQERCREVADRQLRVWKARRVKDLWDAHHAEVAVWEAKANKAKDAKPPKAPTEVTVEAAYRTHPDYDKVQTLVEACREAARFAQTVVSAAEAKRADLSSMARMMSSGA